MSFRKKSIAISNFACNLGRESELVCKDRVYVDSGAFCSQEGESRSGPIRRY
jgi:hypothetical protein